MKSFKSTSISIIEYLLQQKPWISAETQAMPLGSEDNLFDRTLFPVSRPMLKSLTSQNTFLNLIIYPNFGRNPFLYIYTMYLTNKLNLLVETIILISTRSILS